MRFPFYLAGHVRSLAIGVSEVSVGARDFKAWICYDGRAVAPKAPPEIGQWEICIGGKKVPALTKEDLASVQAKKEGTWESRWRDRMQARNINTVRKQYYKQAYLWFRDLQLIDKTRNFKYATMLKGKEIKQHLEAYFQIGGLIMEAADNGVGEVAAGVLCFDVKNPVTFKDSKLWLSIREGDMLITLDAPFVLHLPQDYEGLVKCDDWQLSCGGVKVAYVLQYQLMEPNGMYIQKGGLVLLQHLAIQRHWAQLFALAGVMQKKMPLWGSQIAYMQALRPVETNVNGQLFVESI